MPLKATHGDQIIGSFVQDGSDPGIAKAQCRRWGLRLTERRLDP